MSPYQQELLDVAGADTKEDEGKNFLFQFSVSSDHLHVPCIVCMW